ncbi:acyl-CoA dehydrogenase family protein [uncultured Agrococcus sp.]|uniref:acyl-CoA dehydrogenase family protein n=1 Tax=uncultured Agrococcus sp. TaxID=382258 RepID=UPI0025D857F4|nr:acyl-CoA dehydrogenase family protein [uncultured Agrococcus sp.]
MTDRETRHAALAQQYLPDELLERFRERAADYDRGNAFFDDDLAELQDRGYLTAFVPQELGGGGLNLQEVVRLQQRLASAAAGTALAINMHQLCTGVAHAMRERGDDSLEFVLRDAAAGEILAFGVSEPANDWVLQGSNTTAEPQSDGSYLLSGVKIFTSLSPVWSRLITHGLDNSNPDEPRLVYGFLDRDTEGISVSDRWDVLGMRPSHSRSTILERARMRPDRVVRRIPTGRHPDLLTFAITSNFQLLVASVYAGVARRALELGAAGLLKRKSAKSGTTFADVPEYRARLADAHMEYLPVPAQIDAYARDFDDLVDHGAGWPLRMVSARIHASDIARRSAEAALQCSGGTGFDNEHELNRVFRDAAAGLFHPPSADAARPMFAAALLDD